ncbi:hypothetical protein ACN4EK_29985 [Pantanalinema rosaneae CENA516]|uniref:hypothetical protein n=1 Tax=Pantanalinema rosaneae TaxID=1620701 RepID=UPI003D6EBD9B
MRSAARLPFVKSKELDGFQVDENVESMFLAQCVRAVATAALSPALVIPCDGQAHPGLEQRFGG